MLDCIKIFKKLIFMSWPQNLWIKDSNITKSNYIKPPRFKLIIQMKHANFKSFFPWNT